MSRLRILVEVDGQAVVDRDVEGEEYRVDTNNEVADTGRGRHAREYMATGHHSVSIEWVDAEQRHKFWGGRS